MLRYDRQTKPGLVALYDIRPGNRAGLFLQPRSPHGAVSMTSDCRSSIVTAAAAAAARRHLLSLDTGAHCSIRQTIQVSIQSQT